MEQTLDKQYLDPKCKNYVEQVWNEISPYILEFMGYCMHITFWYPYWCIQMVLHHIYSMHHSRYLHKNRVTALDTPVGVYMMLPLTISRLLQLMFEVFSAYIVIYKTGESVELCWKESWTSLSMTFSQSVKTSKSVRWEISGKNLYLIK